MISTKNYSSIEKYNTVISNKGQNDVWKIHKDERQSHQTDLKPAGKRLFITSYFRTGIDQYAKNSSFLY